MATLVQVLAFVSFGVQIYCVSICGGVRMGPLPTHLDCNQTMECQPEDCGSGQNFSLTTNYRGLRGCDCHPDCYTYGSCCLNYESVCGHESPSVTTEMRWQASTVTCELLTTPKKDSIKSFVVTKCPRPLFAGVSQKDVQLCEHLNETFDQFVPVYKEPLLYRNMYCLRCHGIDLTAADEIVGTDFQCTDYFLSTERNVSLEALTIPEANALIKSKNCRLQYQSDFPHLYCYMFYVDTCDQSFQDLQDFDVLERHCRSYASYITISGIGFDSFFKNMHCAECNGFLSVRSQCVEDAASPPYFKEQITRFNYVPTLSILLDFSGRASTKLTALRSCKDRLSTGLVSVATNKCVNKVCQHGYLLFNSTHCIMENSLTFSQMNSISSRHKNQVYNMKILIHYEPSMSEIDDFLGQLIGLMNYERAKHLIGSKTDCAADNGLLSCLEVIMISDDIYADAYTCASTTFQDNLMALCEAFGINGVQFIIPDSSTHGGQSNNNESEIRAKIDIVTNNTATYGDISKLVDEGAESMQIYVPQYDTFLSFQQTFFDFGIEKNESGEWKTWVMGIMKVKENFNCSEIDACWPILTDQMSSSDDLPVVTSAERYLSAIGIILSTAALTLSIIIRCAFLVQINLNFAAVVQICIQLSLLLANALYLVGNYYPSPNYICVFLAAFQQYFWLSSFAFMNVLSALLYKLFSVTRAAQGVSSCKKAMYMAYGWGFPALIVTTCLTLHFFGLFSYASGGLCWIENTLELGLGFGLPLALMLSVNVFLFFLTSSLLWRAMKEAERASEAYTLRFRLALQMRLFCIMGCTWIFGFLSNVPHLHFFSYAFVTLVSLNGLFISLNFTLNSEMIKVFRAQFGSVSATKR